MSESGQSPEHRTLLRRGAMVLGLLYVVSIGITCDALAAAILFRRYSVFEAIVVCLLVMILAAVATMGADLGPGGFLRSPDLENNASSLFKTDETDALQKSRALLKTVFYAIASIMALIRLLLSLVGWS